MIAARQIAMGKAAGGGLPTARDYIQDGLVAMWDGIENVGYGEHDSNATTWKDLIGSFNIPLQSGWVFGDNYMYVVAGTKYRENASSLSFANGGTIEVVVDPASINSDGKSTIIGPAVGEGLEIALYTDGIGFRFSSYARNPKISCTSLGRIYQAAFTWNTAGETIGYLEGAQAASTTNSGMRTNGRFLGVNGTPWENYGMTGKHHAARFYNRALTAEEIAYNHSIDQARFGIA